MMPLLLLQIVFLVLGILFLLMGAGEKVKFNRASDCLTGAGLLITLYVTMFLGG